MVTLGMMCHVLTATTTPVLKVLGIARFIPNVNPHEPDSASRYFKTAFKMVVANSACHCTQKWNRLRGKVTPIKLTQVKGSFGFGNMVDYLSNFA